MPVALIAQLLATLGPTAFNLITSLIQKWETNGTVTSTEWAGLIADAQLSPADRMKKQLAAAGIDLADPHAVALLKLAA